MKYKGTLRKAVELTVGFTAVSLLLAGCLGGGSGTAAVGAGAATTTTTVTPFKGMFQSGTVTLIDANGNPVSLVSGGSINGTTGVATLTYPTNVAYPLTVRVNGTYLDETNGFSPASMVAGSYLSGFIPSAADAASGVPVTAITDIARAMLPASGISAASAVAALTGVASGVLGASGYAQAMANPVFDTTGHTADVNTIKLAALAQVISGGTGTDLIAKLRNMTNQLLAGSAVNAVITPSAFSTALSSMNSASGVLPASSVAPTIALPALSGATLGSFIAAAIPNCPNGLLASGNGLVCAPASGGANQTACAAAGGMWDPFINVCLNLPASGVGATGGTTPPVTPGVGATGGTTPPVTPSAGLSLSPAAGSAGTRVSVNGLTMTQYGAYQPNQIKFGATPGTGYQVAFVGTTGVSVSALVPAGLAPGVYTVTYVDMTGAQPVLTAGTFTVQ